MEGGLQVERLPAGEADAALAEVNRPGIFLASTGQGIGTGDFGKAETVVSGDTIGAATVPALNLFANGVLGKGQALEVAARRIIAGQAIVSNVLVFREKNAVANQQASAVGREPVRAERWRTVRYLRCDIGAIVKISGMHAISYAKNDPETRGSVHLAGVAGRGVLLTAAC